MLKKITIDLSGPDGNAFALISVAKHECRLRNLDSDKITNDMKSGDYYNLLKIFEYSFSDKYKLINKPKRSKK
jgi:hypothetical protein